VAPIKDDKIDDQELVDDHCQITMLRWHALLHTVVVLPIVNQMYQRNFFIFFFYVFNLIRNIDVRRVELSNVFNSIYLFL
jgi:hypothetical protein